MHTTEQSFGVSEIEMFLKEDSFAHQDQKYSKTVIL